ncbi:MAG: hypothetical protein JWO92_1863 [Chitinophagaceae bacterium]|nr:hypothetical protein [Chitinophagaceae bacterium]
MAPSIPPKGEDMEKNEARIEKIFDESDTLMNGEK